MYENFMRYLFPQYWRQDEPEANAPIKYHPHFGFEDRLEDRQLKRPSATEEEMDAVGLELYLRNECAYWHIRYRGCISHSRPFSYHCQGIRREIGNCYLKEKVDDIKEFERERRLNARERKLLEAMQ